MSEAVPYFTKNELIDANNIAIKRGYNRTLSAEQVSCLVDFFYPVSFSMIHEHAAGVKVDPHVRCMVYLGASTATLDCDIKIFNGLNRHTIEPKSSLKTLVNMGNGGKDVPGKFKVGDRVKCVDTDGARSDLVNGIVVYYKGRHSAREPRVRWASGWGTSVSADLLVLMTEEECAIHPVPELVSIDFK